MKNTKVNDNWEILVNSQKSKSEKDNINTFPKQISSYVFIFDCEENKILFVNNAFETLTGYKTKKFNLDLLIEIIHPEDLQHFFNCEEKGLIFTNKLSFDEHFQYKLIYSYRIKTSKGEYIRIRQECQAIEVNNSGHLTKTFVTHKKIENADPELIQQHRIFDKSQNIYIDSENRYNLTKRELEILCLIKDGYNSQQIADQLFLSKNTVLTHRKNILNKTSSVSFIELIKKLSYNHNQ